MKTKHTPGPWKPSFVGTICIGVQNGDFYGKMICNSILPDSDDQYEKEKFEIEANAHLIAAAPELLEALEAFLKYWDWSINDSQFEEYRKAKSALAKAKGE